ncbi:hypothetical protein M378DRAFT_162850 [Amanita muscaria Koide BX008]|uniref:Uncharacterized protein n=1 Tax=Amanita muscaria (strain Koide BX008) TaxID=946122 RepID=A0A0C2X7J0_AMAMK|nr:hypothetical protein M378DRAFT_162850 [Amanita muscaria Koide BX008]
MSAAFSIGEVEVRAYDEERSTSREVSSTTSHFRMHLIIPGTLSTTTTPEIIRHRNLPWEEDHSQTETHSPIRIAAAAYSTNEPSRIEITRRDLRVSRHIARCFGIETPLTHIAVEQ